MLEPWVARSALSMRECGVGRGVLPTALPAPLSATLSPALLVYLCANVGPKGLLVLGLPVPLVPHSTMALRVLSTPVPCLHPSYWSG